MNYLYSFYVGIATFLLLAFFLTIPYMLYQYHRRHAVLVSRTFVVFSFIFYLICAYYLVILPLPTKEAVDQMTGPTTQLIPFMFVIDFFQQTALVITEPSTYLLAIKQNVFIQPLFNIVLTIPFGVYLRFYFKLNFKKTLILSMLLALFFELTQLSGLYGIYSRAYRLFDVDDLMLNTLGSLIGYAISPIILWFYPSVETMESWEKKRAINVSSTRRLLTYIADVSFYSVMINIVRFFYPHVNTVISGLLFVFYFGMVPLVLNNQTIAMKITHIKIKSYHKLGKLSIILRVIYLYASFYLITHALDLISALTGDNGLLLFVLVLLYVGYLAFIVVHFMRIFINHSDGFYGKLSKTTIISAISDSKKNIS